MRYDCFDVCSNIAFACSVAGGRLGNLYCDPLMASGAQNYCQTAVDSNTCAASNS